jgi:LrgB-like family
MMVIHSKISLTIGLQEYRTPPAYIQYFFGPRNDLPPPGAGNILAAVLDVSIVSLALPMYNYRAELKRHVFSLFTRLTSVHCNPITESRNCSCFIIHLSLDLSCHWNRLISCSCLSSSKCDPRPRESGSHQFRYIPQICIDVGGSIPLVVVLAILSGIIGVLIGGYILKILRIPAG